MVSVTVAAERSEPAAATARRQVPAVQEAVRGARLRSWKTVLIESLGRELYALQRQQQERAFMATTHGLNYSAAGSRPVALH